MGVFLLRARRACSAVVVLAVTMTTLAVLPVPALAKTIKLSAHVIQVDNNYTVAGSARCALKTILLINVPSDVISYQASVDEPGVGLFSFSGPPFTNPIVGYGQPYTVPAGAAGWFLGGGSGGGSCSNVLGEYRDPQATGVLGCPGAVAGASAGNEAGADAAARAAAAGAPCRLKVTVKQLDSLRSGLALHSQPYVDPKASGANFPADFVGYSGATEHYRCESGCTDLLVTVTNAKTGAAVPGASVSAGTDDTFRGPDLIVRGHASLCGELANGRTDYDQCGSSVSGLKTDSNGQVRLRYWAPGVNAKLLVDVDVHATAEGCSASGCSLRKGAPTPQPTLILHPYLAYEHDGDLEPEQVDDLTAWAGGGSSLTKFLETSARGHKALTFALSVLQGAEIAAETAEQGLEVLEATEPLFGLIELGIAYNDLQERNAMIALFLTTTDLSAAGLYDPPSEASAPEPPSAPFSYKLVNYNTFLPGGIGAGGLWWDIADFIRRSAPHTLGRWGLRLKIYELSNCDPGAGECDPGYRNDPGFATVLRDGIQPELELQATVLVDGLPTVSYEFGMFYDAISWDESQPGILGLITDK